MDTALSRVSMREFRAHLAQYAASKLPIAITRHGETAGYYIPARRSPDKAEIEALKEAASRLDSLLAEAGVNEDELVAEFRKLRNSKKQ